MLRVLLNNDVFFFFQHYIQKKRKKRERTKGMLKERCKCKLHTLIGYHIEPLISLNLSPAAAAAASQRTNNLNNLCNNYYYYCPTLNLTKKLPHLSHSLNMDDDYYCVERATMRVQNTCFLSPSHPFSLSLLPFHNPLLL